MGEPPDTGAETGTTITMRRPATITTVVIMGAVNGIMVGITAAGTMGATIAEGANHPVLVPSRERQAVVARDLLDAAIMVECHRQCGSLPTFWCCPSSVLQSPQHQPTTSAGVH
ncbi:hypothetical protein EAH89_10760 [Roseomonas nepalensis]|uniref:Uncharacterized protein n=1 Tax=Muricoccus nepalensis TaxID=1854500 RepID=A0A502G5T2_9PROT|nr:hypothetical protein EAH89_10760 [Roseomonas nepalensis]